MPLYRCTNCMDQAEHPSPKCEPCGLDPKTEPRAAGIIVELVTIHFDPPHATVTGWGLGKAACNDKLRAGGPEGERFSGERDAVTCPACRTSEAFAKAEGKPVGPHESIKLKPKAAAAV